VQAQDFLRSQELLAVNNLLVKLKSPKVSGPVGVGECAMQIGHELNQPILLGQVESPGHLNVVRGIE
jgi:hypothetical protein